MSLPLEQPCGCSDCEAAVGPAAYLADLLDYTLKFVRNSNAKIDLQFLVDKFHQPFIDLPTDCTAVDEPLRQVRICIEVLRSRWADYRVERSLLTASGPYKVRLKFLSAMVPVNLIDEIKMVGFDYNMSPREVADAIRKGHTLLYDRELALELDGRTSTTSLAEPSTPTGLSAKNESSALE